MVRRHRKPVHGLRRMRAFPAGERRSLGNQAAQDVLRGGPDGLARTTEGVASVLLRAHEVPGANGEGSAFVGPPRRVPSGQAVAGGDGTHDLRVGHGGLAVQRNRLRLLALRGRRGSSGFAPHLHVADQAARAHGRVHELAPRARYLMAAEPVGRNVCHEFHRTGPRYARE
jgi:hypothetical protein